MNLYRGKRGYSGSSVGNWLGKVVLQYDQGSSHFCCLNMLMIIGKITDSL